ncbi:hypothetical protein RhiirA5_432287 [Rhizophagus irregularis]|uniref:Uncharacterized protein n=1 Tax=Rhizophagus irregularis TaxID=588596 RepID=A0A2N0NTM6_9GLOM|nr:hypothetical protein RhiirA5_432287 [Rhizophagus irregularis]
MFTNISLNSFCRFFLEKQKKGYFFGNWEMQRVFRKSAKVQREMGNANGLSENARISFEAFRFETKIKCGSNIYLMIHMKIIWKFLLFFTVHNYDERVQNQQELRSMKNINLKRAITLRLNKKENSGISPQILSIIPMIGLLHISLNSRETLFQQYHFFFEMIYHDLFEANKILAQKPKPRLINLILNLTFYGSKNICNLIINRFRNIKDVEYLMMIDLLDNSLPLTLDIYTKLFRCRFFEGYLKSVIKIWILFQRLHRHNYNKAPLIFLSDVFSWTLNDHPILDILKNNLPIFNDYFVENFHSSLRYQTAKSNTDKQIIQKAKTIDIERNDDEFKNTFINTKNTNISKVKLISLEKKVSLFLLSFFNIIYHNIGKSSNNNNNNMFELPSFNNRNVNVKLFPLAWSTSNIPDNDKFCKYCFNYLSESIKTNITSLNKRLFKPLKDNEISEFTEDKGLDEDYDDENIDSLLEQEEYNINNQYKIQYNIWLNYNNM